MGPRKIRIRYVCGTGSTVFAVDYICFFVIIILFHAVSLSVEFCTVVLPPSQNKCPKISVTYFGTEGVEHNGHECKVSLFFSCCNDGKYLA